MARVHHDLELLNLAKRLLAFDPGDFESHVFVNANECLSVCQLAIQAMKSTEICITVNTPINIVGDLHGQFHDLLRIFDALGLPPQSRFLFLGDFVDRGKYSLEVMTLLFALMLLYPNSVYLLRGNHETANICCRYGFKDEISMRYSRTQSHKVLAGFISAFQWMPLCAIVDGHIFCCHGGISPSFMLPPFKPKAGQQANVQTLNDHKKPVEPVRPSFLCDLLWSDPLVTSSQAMFDPSRPTATEAKWVPSKRGCSFMFSGPALEEVMRIFKTQMLVRGHQLAPNGYHSQLNRRCVTVFSAPGYCGTYNNPCGVLQVERMTEGNRSPGSFYLLKPMQRSPAAISNLFWMDLKDI